MRVLSFIGKAKDFRHWLTGLTEAGQEPGRQKASVISLDDYKKAKKERPQRERSEEILLTQ